MLDIGLSTASFYPDYPTEKAIDIIGDMGIDVAELFLGSYSEYNREFCQGLIDTLNRHNMHVHSVHTLSSQFEPQLFASTYRQRKDSLDIWLKVLEGAQAIGAEVYVFHGPPVRLNTQPKLDFKRIGRITDELSNIAADFGIKFSWENVYWCWYSDPQFAVKLLENTKGDNIYFTLDIKQAIKSGYSPEEFLYNMGDRVANVHICDFDKDGNLYLPGMGEYDFKGLYAQLHRQGYCGPIILEVYRTNYNHYLDMLQSIDFFKSIFSCKLYENKQL